MKKEIKSFILGCVFTSALMTSVSVFAEPILKTISVGINAVKIEVNDQKVNTDNFVYNGTTYVPLRAVSQMLDKEVTFNNKTSTVNISDKDGVTINTVEPTSEPTIEPTYIPTPTDIPTPTITPIPTAIPTPTVTQIPSDTNVSGYISTDMVWDNTNKPYIVKGNICIEENATLTIKPGVKVLFDGRFEIISKGKLNAIGDKNNHIIFDSLKPTSYQIGGISLYSNNNTLEYCNINNAEFCGLFINSSSNQIKNCEIAQNYFGIRLKGSANVIENCNIYNNNYTGIDVLSPSENSIKSCNIYNNIRFNISVCANSPSKDYTIDITNNYWGSTDESDILKKIKDYTKDSNLSKTNYAPFLINKIEN